MNEKRNPDAVEIVNQQQIKKGLTAYGNMYPHRGHTVFEYNMITGELHRAEIKAPEKPVAQFTAQPKKVLDIFTHEVKEPKAIGAVEMNDDCIYFTALNFKNAIKLLKREYGIEYVDPSENRVSRKPENE